MRRSVFPDGGLTVFPSRTARLRGERVGRTPFRRCVQCGLPNDTRKTAWAKAGDGLGPATAVTTQVTGETVENAMDHDVVSGCRFCGSLQWSRSKPVAIKDDPKAPSDEWFGRRRQRR